MGSGTSLRGMVRDADRCPVCSVSALKAGPDWETPPGTVPLLTESWPGVIPNHNRCPVGVIAPNAYFLANVA